MASQSETHYIRLIMCHQERVTLLRYLGLHHTLQQKKYDPTLVLVVGTTTKKQTIPLQAAERQLAQSSLPVSRYGSGSEPIHLPLLPKAHKAH